MRLRFLVAFALLCALSVSMVNAQDDMGGLTLTPLGTYDSGAGFDEGGAEIVAYDAESQTMFITNGATGAIDVVNISDPAAPVYVNTLSVDAYGGVNSIAVGNGLVAVAVENPDDDFAAGSIVLFNTVGMGEVAVFDAGVLPDMVTFSPDGNYILAANEGEPSDDYTNDPEGSITIIDISGGVEAATATQVTFEAFNDAIPEGVRVFGPGSTLAQDLEPEYITVSPDSATAFVIAQENNAMIVIDIAAGEIITIAGLGTKDYSVPGNEIDASNEDGAINLQNWPVQSFYMPDSIAAFEIGGEVFIATANEGDARDYDGFSEEARVADVMLDPEAFPNAEELQQEASLGRLLITTTAGDTDGDGDFDELYGYGARSFTIWNTDLEIVFDSGSDFERIIAEMLPGAFNSNGTTESFDSRSDDKGPEPEALTIGAIGESTYAFIGMERVGGIFVYDVTDPANASFITYANNTNIEAAAESGEAGDLAPEGMIFISAEDSPTGTALLLVANEVSGTTTIWEISDGM